ncbi:MAG TPA: gamma-glutamyl-gamma-aminobutyrate hydrolase family protein, partial [Nitriliruptorales bacterium]
MSAEREFDQVLVVDFGAQYAQLIARRVREAHVYSEIVPHSITADEVRAKAPQAIILSGGPKSVNAPGAPRMDRDIFQLGIPMLGICYGQQLMAVALGGEVSRSGVGEYGKSELAVQTPGVVMDGTPERQTVWMSHFDAVVTP